MKKIKKTSSKRQDVINEHESLLKKLVDETLYIHERINTIDKDVSELIKKSLEFSLDVVFCDQCGVALKRRKASSMKFMGTDLNYNHPKFIEKMLDEDEDDLPGVANIVEKYFCKNCNPGLLNKTSEKGNFFSRMWKKINKNI